MEKDMNKEADIVEETAVVNEVTDSSEEIVAVNAAVLWTISRRANINRRC